MSDQQSSASEPRWERPTESLADEAAPPDVPIGKKVLDAVDLVAGYIPEVNILNGCNLTVNAGEFVGIIGPNGAGKSTLLKAILGQCSIRSGSIHLGDRDITGRRAHELVAMGVGYVPQVRNVFPSLTVKENLEMGCFLAKKRFHERFDYVTTLFPRLGERATQRAGALSGGERQMVAMGRALMPDPQILLLDEPSAGLAPAFVDAIFEKVIEVNRAGVTILMVEQNARRALALSHRGYVLDLGQNKFTGPGPELIADPKVADLYLGGGAGRLDSDVAIPDHEVTEP